MTNNEYSLIVFQVTVGDTYYVKANGLNDIVLAYPENIQQFITLKLLVFITPILEGIHTIQPIHTQENEVSTNIPIPAQNFHQCYCRYNITI